MKTRVLFSSIFFIADSVFNGLNSLVKMQTSDKPGQHSRDNRPELVHPRYMGNRLARVLGVTGEAEGLGAAERDGVAHFARDVRVRAGKCGLPRSLGLGLLRRCCEIVSLIRLMERRGTYPWRAPCGSLWSS